MRITVLVLALAATGASAQLSSTGPFAGAFNDDFESYNDYSISGGGLPSLGIMGGGASMVSNPGTSAQVWIYDVNTATWGLGANGPALANSGVQGMGLFNGGSAMNTTLKFTTGMMRFGGYFAVENDSTSTNTLTLSFYDASNAQIGATQSISSSSNAMVWFGWNSTIAIDHIDFGGGAIAPVMDDFQADAVPEPATMTALGLGIAALIARRRR